MPTTRRRIGPRRIDRTVPAWARQLLAGERPEPETDGSHAYFGWMFCGEEVPGLPDGDSPEGLELWRQAKER